MRRRRPCLPWLATRHSRRIGLTSCSSSGNCWKRTIRIWHSIACSGKLLSEGARRSRAGFRQTGAFGPGILSSSTAKELERPTTGSRRDWSFTGDTASATGSIL